MCITHLINLYLLQAEIDEKGEGASREIRDAVNGIIKCFEQVDVYAVPGPGSKVIKASEASAIQVSGR